MHYKVHTRLGTKTCKTKEQALAAAESIGATMVYSWRGRTSKLVWTDEDGWLRGKVTRPPVAPGDGRERITTMLSIDALRYLQHRALERGESYHQLIEDILVAHVRRERSLE